MPKVSVYLPDDMYSAARARELSLSSLLQRAVERELAQDATARWVERVRSRPRRHVGEYDIEKLMDEVRDELGT